MPMPEIGSFLGQSHPLSPFILRLGADDPPAKPRRYTRCFSVSLDGRSIGEHKPDGGA